VRSIGTAATVVTCDTTCGVIVGAGTITEVHGHRAQIDEHPHGAPSGHPSSLPLSLSLSLQRSLASSALATVITPVVVTRKATITKAWSRRGT
jgi:hypothetical protein